MKRKSVLLSIALLISLVLSAAGSPPSASGTVAGTGSTTQVTLDPRLPVHPYLQYGARVEPNRPVRIVVQKTGPTVSSQALAQAAQTAVLDEFPLVNGLLLEVPQRVTLSLARQPGVRYISYDAPVQRHAIDTANLRTTYQGTIGVPQLWNDTVPATGQGVTVAVLDSGVNDLHPDLTTNLVCIKVNGRATNCKDPHGHGTHIIGTIKGKDPQGRYIGVAPDARVLSLKIADDTGMSTESDLLKGLQWVNDNRATYNIRAVNLSVSGSVATSYVSSPLSAAVEQLWLNGVIVIAAAGNRGSVSDAAWYPPGNDPFLISVGALDHNETVDGADDSLATFSSRGTSQDGYYKPHILAPGRKIVAPLAGTNVTVATTFPDRIVDTNYIRLSGTSMATPVVVGVVALILERYPSLTPNEVKWLLLNTAKAYPSQADAAGVVDPVRALQVAAAGSLGIANQGLTLNNGIDPTTNTVTWGTVYWDQAYWDQAYWDQSTYEMVQTD